MAEQPVTRDLFGDLRTLPQGGRGRPAHCWSQSAENRVLLGCALGLSDAQIASGLGISVPTLRKYYFSALKRRDMQRARAELWLAEALADKVNAGDLGAIREMDKRLQRADRRRQAQEVDEAQAKAAPQGKKARAAADAARAVADGWGGDLQPGRWH
jgi:hypothetical protein